MPDQVDIGEPFTILVNTPGNSCTKIAVTEVTVQDRMVRIVPYNENPGPNSDVVCAEYRKPVFHAAAAWFPSPGEVTVRVVGYNGYGPPEEQLDSLDYTVVVGP